MELAIPQGVEQVYAGVEMKIGRGWIPDFVEVCCDLAEKTCTIRLIELEATETVALISARKYLPEESSRILRAFDTYLDRILDLCRSTSDPRRSAFLQLKTFLTEARSIIIRTAGALRTSRTLLEDLPLIDQPRPERISRCLEPPSIQLFRFEGEVSLTPRERKTLFRALLILDGVVRGRDHSGANLKNWLGLRTQPLKVTVRTATQQYHFLQAFLASDTRSGGRVDCDGIAQELATLWSGSCETRFDLKQVSTLVTQYFPTAVLLRKYDPMSKVFEGARTIVGEIIATEKVA